MNPTNPISIIKSDHEKVKSLIEEYKESEIEEKKDQAMKICENLAIHMEMEEAHFYPEVEKISDEAEELIADALDEHNELKTHIGNIDANGPEEELDEHMGMIEETLEHHLEEEENNILPLAENNLSGDFTAMAAKMIAYKTQAKGQELLKKIKEKLA